MVSRANLSAGEKLAAGRTRLLQRPTRHRAGAGRLLIGAQMLNGQARIGEVMVDSPGAFERVWDVEGLRFDRGVINDYLQSSVTRWPVSWLSRAAWTTEAAS